MRLQSENLHPSIHFIFSRLGYRSDSDVFIILYNIHALQKHIESKKISQRMFIVYLSSFLILYEWKLNPIIIVQNLAILGVVGVGDNPFIPIFTELDKLSKKYTVRLTVHW